MSGLCAHESRGQKTDNILPVRKIRSLDLEPGKSSHPLPPKKNVGGLATHSRGHGSRPDIDQCIRPGFSCRLLGVSPKMLGRRRRDMFEKAQKNRKLDLLIFLLNMIQTWYVVCVFCFLLSHVSGCVPCGLLCCPFLTGRPISRRSDYFF